MMRGSKRLAVSEPNQVDTNEAPVSIWPLSQLN